MRYALPVCMALSGALGFVACWGIHKPAPVAVDHRVVAMAESLATARAEAAARLQSWRDSLQSMQRDTVVRRVVRYIRAHDTALVWRDSMQTDTVEVVRWLAASDSGCRVSLDSIEGELGQARFDADQCAEELAKRPATGGRWSSFWVGFLGGAAAGLAACVAL